MAWTTQTSSFGTTRINAVCFGNDLFVAAGNSGKLATSTDTVNWTQQTSGLTAFDTINCLCYGGGLYVAGSGVITTSPDGINWTIRSINFAGEAIYSLCYGNGLFVAVGSGGKLATSSDGITWTLRTSGFGSSAIYSVCYGNGLFVIAGQLGLLATSSNGISWTHRTSSFSSNYIYSLAYGNGVYVAVGDIGKVATSTDAITWTQKTTGLSTSYPARAVAYANQRFYVGAGNGQIRFSTNNGENWTSESSGFGTNTVYGLAYGVGFWVAVGNAGKLSNNAVPIPILLTPNQLALATVGLDWTRAYSDTPFQNALALIGYAPKTFQDTYKRQPNASQLTTNGLLPEIKLGLKLAPSIRTLLRALYVYPVFANRLLYAITPGYIKTRYFCKLTGHADGLIDLQIPIKSFQTRYTSDYMYLSCVVPGVDAYQVAIDARPNGRLMIEGLYDYLDGSYQKHLLATVPFETLRIDSGGRSGLTATLSGSDFYTTLTALTIELFDVIYYSVSDGSNRRYRCRLDPRLRVGDTAIIDGQSIIVGSIVHIVDVKSTLMEISEA